VLLALPQGKLKTSSRGRLNAFGGMMKRAVSFMLRVLASRRGGPRLREKFFCLGEVTREKARSEKRLEESWRSCQRPQELLHDAGCWVLEQADYLQARRVRSLEKCLTYFFFLSANGLPEPLTAPGRSCLYT